MLIILFFILFCNAALLLSMPNTNIIGISLNIEIVVLTKCEIYSSSSLVCILYKQSYLKYSSTSQ